MQKPKTIGIGLSKRENAVLVFQQCQKTFRKTQTIVTSQLEFRELKQNKEFLQSDLIICFGGDGSFLKVCQAVQKPTPVFLVGCGERNYLQTIEASQAPKIIEEILNGKYRTEKRERIAVGKKGLPPCLNEIIIAPERSATALHYELYIDSEKKWADYSDGILVCTPTGSSAYFSATDGPEIDCCAPVVGIASLNSIEKRKKIICSNQKKIQIQAISSTGPVEIILDGQQRAKADSSIEIFRSKKPVWLGFPLQSKAKTIHSLKATPSARLVLNLLQANGPSTQQELIQKSGLHPRSVRRGLQQLLNQKRIVQRPYSNKDKRQDLYTICPKARDSA